MDISDLQLSETGGFLLKSVVIKVNSELKKFGRIRTRFFYSSKNNKRIFSVELREFIDSIIRKYNLRSPFESRDSNYFQFINTKLFDVMGLQLHRLHPKNYILVTQNTKNRIIFIIRDIEIFETANIKLVWNDALTDFSKEDAPFYMTKDQLEL